MGLRQSVEGLDRPKTDLPRAGGSSASRLTSDLNCDIVSPWISSLQTLPSLDSPTSVTLGAHFLNVSLHIHGSIRLVVSLESSH